jgi:hypothetical protein
VWECPDGKRNEPWDDAVYNYAALKSTPVDIKAASRPSTTQAEARKRSHDPLPAPAVARQAAPDAEPGSSSLKPGILTAIGHERDSHMPRTKKKAPRRLHAAGHRGRARALGRDLGPQPAAHQARTRPGARLSPKVWRGAHCQVGNGQEPGVRAPRRWRSA